MPGSSDGGAHLLSFCGADYTTRLLTEWADVLTIEQAVARLTSIPAAACGITDRGTLAPGRGRRRPAHRPRPASPPPETPRYVRDFPAGSGRYVVDATGYQAVIVNGVTLLREGVDTGARPGHIVGL